MSVEEEVIPLVEEEAVVSKRRVESGRVRVRTRVEEREEWVRVELARDEVQVDRIPVDREIDAIPPIREEGGAIIVPVVEEVLVVEKRLRLVEEIHLRRTRSHEQVSQPVTLASQRAEIERHETSGEEPA